MNPSLWLRSSRLATKALMASIVIFNLWPKAVKAESLDNSIVLFSQYIVYHWSKDKNLKQTVPPQIITNIGSGTKIIGGCAIQTPQGIKNEVGGTSYCARTNTIYVVPEQLQPLYKYFGPASVAYALAHEYGHYLQHVYKINPPPVAQELQADCIAGAIIGQDYKILEVTQEDVINMAQAAYSIGDATHGSGDKRAYALFTGLGHSKELTCKTLDMVKLEKGNVADPMFKQLSSKRAASQNPSLSNKGIYIKSISGSLGI